MKSILLRKIRWMIILFVVVLALSGITAFPVYSELKWIIDNKIFDQGSDMGMWLNKVWTGVSETHGKYPFLFYGYDWLAFAHLMIALAFIGPYRDPVKNRWIIEWAILCCICIIPLAFIAGTARGIPRFHILIDCSFALIGIIPLLVTRRWILQLKKVYLLS
ncbi:MAG: hypothetical protein SFU87_13115 [Chitinophagaceae bacterium]|nr:hypothetical protein [Chitinophagaceae bacterium]